MHAAEHHGRSTRQHGQQAELPRSVASVLAVFQQPFRPQMPSYCRSSQLGPSVAKTCFDAEVIFLSTRSFGSMGKLRSHCKERRRWLHFPAAVLGSTSA